MRKIAVAFLLLVLVAGLERRPTVPTQSTTVQAAAVEITTTTTAPTTTTEETTTTTEAPPTTISGTVHASAKVAAKPDPPPQGSGDAYAAVQEFFGDVFLQAWGADDGSPYGVTRCESGRDPGAVSPGGGNWGLFQLNTTHKADFEKVTGQSWNSGVLNAHYNAMYARKLYNSSGGWGPWSCRWAASG